MIFGSLAKHNVLLQSPETQFAQLKLTNYIFSKIDKTFQIICNKSELEEKFLWFKTNLKYTYIRIFKIGGKCALCKKNHGFKNYTKIIY